MNVLDIMTPKIVTVFKKDTLARACALMQEHQMRHLVVIRTDGSIVGIISDRDCKEACASPFAIYDTERAQSFAEKVLVQRIMTPTPTCVTPQTSVQEAANLMLEQKINALPVLHDGTVIGIVTSSDLLKVLASLPTIAVTPPPAQVIQGES